MEDAAYKYKTYHSTCFTECYQSTSDNCSQNCYKKYVVDTALCSNNNHNNTTMPTGKAPMMHTHLADMITSSPSRITSNAASMMYTQWTVTILRTTLDCANQGGNILGFFQDEYCSIASAYQANYFEKMTEVEIP